jgi:hypothetical protein
VRASMREKQSGTNNNNRGWDKSDWPIASNETLLYH